MSDEADLHPTLEQEIKTIEAESRNSKTKLRALQLELARATAEDVAIDARLADLRTANQEVAQADTTDFDSTNAQNLRIMNTADQFKDAVDKVIALAQAYKVELDGATNSMKPTQTVNMLKWEQLLVCLGHDASLPAITDSEIFLEDEELEAGVRSFLDGYTLPVDDLEPAALYFKTIGSPEEACPEWIQSAALNCTRNSLGYFEQSIKNVSKLPNLTTRQAIFILRGIDFLQSVLKPNHLNLAWDLLDDVSLPPSAVVHALQNFLSCNRRGWRRSRGYHFLNFAPSYSPQLMPGVKAFSEEPFHYIAREGAIIEFDGEGFDYAWNSDGQMVMTIHEEESGFAGEWVIPKYTRKLWAPEG